jgi:hypothetical protein
MQRPRTASFQLKALVGAVKLKSLSGLLRIWQLDAQDRSDLPGE